MRTGRPPKCEVIRTACDQCIAARPAHNWTLDPSLLTLRPGQWQLGKQLIRIAPLPLRTGAPSPRLVPCPPYKRGPRPGGANQNSSHASGEVPPRAVRQPQRGDSVEPSHRNISRPPGPPGQPRQGHCRRGFPAGARPRQCAGVRDRHRQRGRLGPLGQHGPRQLREARRRTRHQDRQLRDRRRRRLQLRQGPDRGRAPRPAVRAGRRLQEALWLAAQRDGAGTTAPTATTAAPTRTRRSATSRATSTTSTARTVKRLYEGRSGETARRLRLQRLRRRRTCR